MNIRIRMSEENKEENIEDGERILTGRYMKNFPIHNFTILQNNTKSCKNIKNN